MGEDKIEFLFTYGTFRDLSIQTAFFKRAVNMTAATLEGYAVFGGEDGFFFISQEENAVTNGFVLELSPQEMWIADQWEEIPFYEREKRLVKTDFGQVEAWVYLKSAENKKIKVDNAEMSANVALAELAEEIQKFQLYQNIRTIPNGDFYMVIDGMIADNEKWRATIKNRMRLKKISNGYKKFSALSQTALKQKNVIMTNASIGGNHYFYLSSHHIKTRIPGAIYFFENEKKVRIIIAFPCLLVDLDDVIKAYETNKLLIETESWQQYLGEVGLQCSGRIRKLYFVNGILSQFDREYEKRLNDDVQWFYYKEQNWYDERIKNHVAVIY